MRIICTLCTKGYKECTCARSSEVKFQDLVTRCFCVPYKELSDDFKEHTDYTLKQIGRTHDELFTEVRKSMEEFYVGIGATE